MSPLPSQEAEAPLAIVAGAGALPWEAAEAIGRRRRVVVLAIEGEADAAPEGVETYRLGYGEVGRAYKLMDRLGARDVLFLGAIRRRPDYRRILGDLETLRLAPKIIRAAVGGDDTAARNVLALIEAEGFRIVSPLEAAPELLAPPGRLGRHEPSRVQEEDIALAMRFLDAAAPFDVGQAAAVAEGRIIALEGAEGTDAMLARCGELRSAKRVRVSKGRMVLVKRAKRTQDLRADLPVVGAGTLKAALDAGFGGIAVEAGRTILAERERLRRRADRAGVFLVAR